MSRESAAPFVVLSYEPTGFKIVCERRSCEAQAHYRALLGSFPRWLCEDCLVSVLLDAAAPRPGENESSLMNPDGAF